MDTLRQMFKGSYNVIEFLVAGNYREQVLKDVTEENNFALGLYEVSPLEGGDADIRVVEEFIPENFEESYRALLNSGNRAYFEVVSNGNEELQEFYQSIGMLFDSEHQYFGVFGASKNEGEPHRAVGVLVPKESYDNLAEKGLGLIF